MSEKRNSDDVATLKRLDDNIAGQIESIFKLSLGVNATEDDEYYHQLDSLFKNIQVMDTGRAR